MMNLPFNQNIMKFWWIYCVSFKAYKTNNLFKLCFLKILKCYDQSAELISLTWLSKDLFKILNYRD